MIQKNRKQTLFSKTVLEIVKSIPKGQTLSYGEVAMRAGSPNGARAVGTIMKNNKDKSIPCHRVIKSNGKIGGYNGLRGQKEKLLRKEGVRL
jgi:methylated-DNA-[protein]-cysteine S-methyltransferase